MKRFLNNTKKSNFKDLYVLSSEEMLKVRGGSDTKPASKEKDIFDLEGN